MLKRLLIGLSLTACVLLLAPVPEAEASSWSWRNWFGSNDHQVRRHHHSNGFGVPELDPSAAGGAMILLLGGVAYIASRRREEDLI